jgi:hypothetical protein
VPFSGELWLQNIDSKDLVWKISGMKILRRLKSKKQIPCGNDNKKGKARAEARATAEATAKAKGRAIAWPSLLNPISLL